MSKKNEKTFTEQMLEVYQKSGLTRRRFLRRLGLQITGAGALIAAFTQTAKACCRPCNSCNACNTGCNASCNVDTCDDDNICEDINYCSYNSCLRSNTCRKNVCDENRCEESNVCTEDTCHWDMCPGAEDICGTNTCYVGNPCDINICVGDDLCLASNVCSPTDIDCGELDISCPLGNCIAPNAPEGWY